MNPIHPQYVVDEQGRPHSVLLKISEFEELIECVQDVLDGQDIERLKDEPCVPWDEIKAQRESGLRE